MIISMKGFWISWERTERLNGGIEYVSKLITLHANGDFHDYFGNILWHAIQAHISNFQRLDLTLWKISFTFMF